MKKIIAFIILLSFQSTSALAFQGLTDVPLDINVVADVMAMNQRKAWTESDLDGETLTSNFAGWLSCYGGQNNGTATSESCRCNATGEPIQGSTINLGLRSCLPDYYDRSLVFNPRLNAEQKIQRDNLICACFNGKQSIEYILGGGGQTSKSQRRAATRQLEQNLRATRERTTLNSVFGDNFGPAVTVMNFGRNGDAERLAQIYIPKGTDLRDDHVRSLERIVENDRNLTDEQCVPPREFIFDSQFPSEPEFFEDLNRPYQEADWNYALLSQRLRTITSVDQIRNNDEIRRIEARMRFLIRNPAFKALFMSNDMGATQSKQDLHAILKKDFPRPQCPTDILNICFFKGTDFHKMMGNYQNKIAGFLSNKAINDDILTGVKRGRELAATSSAPVSDAAMNFPEQGSYDDWSNFCQLRSANVNPEALNPVVLQIEADTRIDYANLSQNRTYQNMNRHFCSTPRKNAQGQEIASFKVYREQSCSNVDRRNCLAKYLKDYPHSLNQVAEITYGDRFEDLLTDPKIFDQIGRGSSQRIADNSQNAASRNESFRTLAEVDRTSRSSGSVDAIPGQTRAPASTPVASSGQTSNSQSQSQQAQLQSGTIFNSTSAPEVQVPSAAQASATPTPRSQATEESQTRVNDLSAELEGLRAQIAQRRDNAENPELASLRRQYSMVEESLRKAQERLAENERLDAERRAAANDDDDEDDSEDTPRRTRRSARAVSGSVAANSVSAASVTPQAAQAASSALAPVSALSSGGGSASLSGGSARQSARSTSTSQNRTASSANGSADISAITVASNSVAEYEQVRAEAAVNQISETASPEVLSQIERGDASFLEQYRQRIAAFPGKYVLLDLGDLEFVVAKNGEQLSLMSKDGRFIASDARPEPVRERTESEREHTLRALQNNLSQ